MLTHLIKVWQWFAQSLGLSSPKVQVSRLEEQNTIEKALKFLNLMKSRKFAEAFENGTSTIELLRLARTYEKAFNVLQTAL